VATYGLDIYGRSLYGIAGSQAYFSCDPMSCAQDQYGALQVTWTTPYQTSGTVPPAWSRQRLVRNSWGVPDTEDDGWVCLDQASGNTDPALGISNTFLDNTVVPGRLYYYGLFVASGITTYSTTQTYQPGDLAVFSSVNYICLALNTLNVTPGTNAAIWATTPVTTPWFRCGSGVVGLALADAGYRSMLYDLIPRPYKVATVETTASSIPVNDDLFDFVSMFGWGLDIMKSENDSLLRMNDIERCSDRQLGLIAQQMGIDSRLPAMPELRRSFVRDANAIQRRAGSASALAELVTDLTGWKTTTRIGYNQLPTLDSSTFDSTLAKPWDPTTYYLAGYQAPNLGDVVTYLGQTYFAYGGSETYSFYNIAGGASVPPGGLVRVGDPLAGVDRGYMRMLGAAIGSSATVFVPMVAGITGTVFNLFVTLVKDPFGGQISATVNGSLVAGWSADMYAPSRQMAQTVYIGTFTPGGDITLTFTVTGKQAISSGYDIFIAHATLQSTSSVQNYGVAPTGVAGSAAAWTQTGLSAYYDADAERNWLTDGQGIWNVQYADGAVNPRNDNFFIDGNSGNFGIVPQAATTLSTGSPGPGNALMYNTFSGATVGRNTIFTCGEVQAATWVSTTAYYAGQPVLWNTPTTGAVYVARSYTVGDTPSTSPAKWRLTSLKNATLPEPALVQTQGIALKQTATWSATATYAKGVEVQWRDAIYQAAKAVPQGASPTGYTTDNIWWRWLGPARRQYTFSAYHYRTATGSGQFVRPRIDWYDQFGALVGTADVRGTGTQQVIDHFNTDGSTYPQSFTAAPPTGWSTPVAWQQGTGIPWVVTYGTWENIDNIVHGSGWNTPGGTTTMLEQMQAGRVLWFDRQWLFGTSAPLDTVYATFVSAPFDVSNTMEHGIYFRGGSAGYWLASRDRLTWTALTYASGFLASATSTTVATYATPVSDGMRMRVNVSATLINVYVRTAPGVETLLATSALTNFNAQTGYGLLERIRI
jgi:hypothetical protein